jgi:DNA polymerase elongation subunit (family B)
VGKKSQVQYTHFTKNDKGEWEKHHGQQFIQNDVYVPNVEAVADLCCGGSPNFHKDLFGNPILVNINCDFFDQNPPEPVRQSAVKFGSDIHPTVKFLADNFEFDEENDEIPPLRVHFMDIESVVDDKGFLQGWHVGPDRQGNSRGGITLISSYDSATGKNTMFGINPYSGLEKLPEDTEYIWCKDEYGVLREYLKYLKDTDPDIITGWNCLEGNQTVWLEDKIVPIKDISKKFNKYPLFTSGNVINNYGYTGDKIMYKIKTALGKTICCSKDHKFFVRAKDKSAYKRTSSMRKLPTQEMTIREIQRLLENQNIYLEFKFGLDRPNLKWRDLILEKSFWDRLIKNPLFDLPIKNRKIIDKVRTDREIKDDYCWGENFWKKSFEWNFKRNHHLYSEEELKNDIFSSDVLDFCFGKKRFSVPLDQEIPAADLQCIGFIFTDGSWDHTRNSISLTQKYEEILQSYGQLILENHPLKSYSVFPIRRTKGNYYSTKISHSHFALLLNLIYSFSDDEKSKNPDITILSLLSTDQFFSYLSGCFDGDGCCSSSITICNFDCQKEGYLEKVHELLLWNGVISTVSQNGNIINIPYHERNRKLIEFLKSKCLNKPRSARIDLNKIRFHKDSFNKLLKYCYDESGGFERINEIVQTNEVIPMYDIETLTHSFYTSGRKTHNCADYDIPYIINRMVLLFGKKSLWHFGRGNVWIDNNKRRFISNGINVIDYMILYKKFELKPRRSYSLDNITAVEGVTVDGEGKHKYKGSIKDFYENDWNGFVRYCAQDAKLVFALDNKKKLMETFITCCYMSGIPFSQAIAQDVSWMRIHDSAIYRFCKEHGTQLPDRTDPPEGAGKFAGAYVMEPIPDVYDYITVFDVASLYPSCIRALNISIEAYRGQVLQGDIPNQRGPFTVRFYSPFWLSLGEYGETILEKHNGYKSNKIDPKLGQPVEYTFPTFVEMKACLAHYNYCVAANGAIFTKDFRGVIPSLLDHWIDIRKKNKKLFFEYKQKYQETKNPKYKALSDRYNTIQMVYKIRLNSLYGFVGTKYSRFYHTDLAEAVTTTGQYVIKSTIEALKMKNPMWDAMYCDTDSCRGDSILRTIDGDKRIEDAFEEQKDLNYDNYRQTYDGRMFVYPEDMKLPYYDEKHDEVKYGKVDFIEKHLVKKKMYKIKTKGGKSVVITSDHSVMVLVEGVLVEKKPEEINKKDKIITLIPPCRYKKE